MCSTDPSADSQRIPSMGWPAGTAAWAAPVHASAPAAASETSRCFEGFMIVGLTLPGIARFLLVILSLSKGVARGDLARDLGGGAAGFLGAEDLGFGAPANDQRTISSGSATR